MSGTLPLIASPRASASSQPPSLALSSVMYLARSATVSRTRRAEYELIAADCWPDKEAGRKISSCRLIRWNRCSSIGLSAQCLTSEMLEEAGIEVVGQAADGLDRR